MLVIPAMIYYGLHGEARRQIQMRPMKLAKLIQATGYSNPQHPIWVGDDSGSLTPEF